MPSLHLNLAKDYRELGDTASSKRYLDAAEAGLGVLPKDGYAAMIRRGIERLRATLAA
jgi:hypothetical protein